MSVSPTDAAKYLCDRSGWTLSNLQLQKIIYMADMNHVGQGNDRLVSESFEAWDYGPVLPSLYHRCKAFGSKPLPDIFWGAGDISETREAVTLDSAWNALKDKPPFHLVSTTHSESSAWIRKYVPGAKQIQISTQDMIDEYDRRRAARRVAVSSQQAELARRMEE